MAEPPYGAKLHKESLLRIPLLAQALDDQSFSVVRRGVDARWHTEEIIEKSVSGFNPLRGAAFISAHSAFSKWMRHPIGSARPFNQGDELVGEALYIVHDYLHCWAYQWIACLHPKLGFGTSPITRRNFEDMVFCHILSEAVATVGLDYWYLATVELNDVVPIGTRQQGLTASYREARLGEYRRFNPGLDVQTPAFLGQMARFYCDGTFVGFSARDLRMSPAVDAWLTHELTYAELQRRYCREWFGYLADDDIKHSAAQLDAPLCHDRPWQKRLIAELEERLWAKVKEDDRCPARKALDPQRTWTAPPGRTPDYRFVNLRRCHNLSPDSVKSMAEDSFLFLWRQYIAQFDFDAFPAEAMGVFKLIRDERDFRIGDRLLRGLKRVPVSPAEPRDLFFYN